MNAPEPRLLVNQFAGAAGPGPQHRAQQDCGCTGDRPVTFHAERQDIGADGWRRLLELIGEAAADRRAEFTPLAEMTAEQRRDVIELPPEIGLLTEVRSLVLYGSNLVRLPPEIGLMRSLESFTPYTSRRLHWFPYELTRCTGLRASTVSTRRLYGNHKNRMPFPALQAVAEGDPTALDPAIHGIAAVRSCSVCDERFTGGFRQVWLTRLVGTDVVPLLVTACSTACADAASVTPGPAAR